MGASLIGVMLQGPLAIDPSLRDQVVAEGVDMFDDRIANTDWETADEQDYEDLRSFCEVTGLACVDEMGLVEAEYSQATVREAIGQSVDDFIAIWNQERLVRDLARRKFTPPQGQQPYMVCFVGDSSWGDAPSGQGYITFEAVSVLGLHAQLGCS